MERVNAKHKASPEEDFISSMPDIIITNILNRWSIDEAVRTGILSPYWRSKWTMLTQLEFHYDFYDFLGEKEKGIQRYYLRIISRLLLHLKGPITKFALTVAHEESCSTLEIEDINNWVVFLSGNGIQDFTLINFGETPLELSTRIFACLELKHLTLYNCCFRTMSSFLGFPNLLSLGLSKVVFESYTCGEFVTQSPLLEDLKLSLNTRDKIKHVEIATLENLKVLRLTLCELDVMTTSSILQLMGGLPQLRDLYLDFHSCKAKYEDDVLPPAAEVDFSRVGQLQLQNLEVICLRGLENELCLIKSLLACSPLLKKMTLYSSSKVFGGQMMLAKRLLKLHRASPVAEIEFF